ncbi:MAG: ArsR/SmtB family transcription factor [Acetobacteraceae bacterium]
MPSTAEFAGTAALIGDPARANMLIALMDGRALTASELARAAGVTPQTASGHLAHLTAAGLLAMARQGRHHYHRLASEEVARMLESIMAVAAGSGRPPVSRAPRTGPRDLALRHARTCYDHLAGQVAVAMADRMIARGQIELSPDGGALTESGAAFLSDLAVDLEAARAEAARRGGGRIFCRPCLDWSERRPHIGGTVGSAMNRAWFAKGWIRRVGESRAVTLTRGGEMTLGRAFDLRLGG